MIPLYQGQRQGTREARLLSGTSRRSRDLHRRSRGGHGHTWSTSGLPCAFERLVAFPARVGEPERAAQARGTEGGGAGGLVRMSPDGWSPGPRTGRLRSSHGLEAGSPNPRVSAGLAPSGGLWETRSMPLAQLLEGAESPWRSLWLHGPSLGPGQPAVFSCVCLSGPISPSYKDTSHRV